MYKKEYVMESTLGSNITLASGRIRETAQYVYLRFLRKRYIPEDFCADLYEQLVKRLKGYKARNPEVKKVKKAFVKNCVRWIVSSLRRKEKTESGNESALYSLIKQEVHTLEKPGSIPLLRKYEKKILGIIRSRLETGKLKRRYVLYFVLYHSYELRPEFAVRILKAAEIKTAVNIRRLKRVRRYVKSRAEDRSGTFVRQIEKNYLKIYRLQLELEKNCDRHRNGFYEQLIEKEKTARKNNYSRLTRIRVVPSVRYIASLLKQPHQNIAYGITRMEKTVKKGVEK